MPIKKKASTKLTASLSLRAQQKLVDDLKDREDRLFRLHTTHTELLNKHVVAVEENKRQTKQIQNQALDLHSLTDFSKWKKNIESIEKKVDVLGAQLSKETRATEESKPVTLVDQVGQWVELDAEERAKAQSRVLHDVSREDAYLKHLEGTIRALERAGLEKEEMITSLKADAEWSDKFIAQLKTDNERLRDELEVVAGNLKTLEEYNKKLRDESIKADTKIGELQDLLKGPTAGQLHILQRRTRELTAANLRILELERHGPCSFVALRDDARKRRQMMVDEVQVMSLLHARGVLSCEEEYKMTGALRVLSWLLNKDVVRPSVSLRTLVPR